MNFYKRFIGDYRKKTARLSPLQHGVYNLLLDEQYATEDPLPVDEDELHEIAHARTPADKAAVKKVIERYFVRVEGGWANERALEEIDKFADKSDKASAASAKRWDGERTSEGISERTSDGISNARSRNSQSQTPDSKAKSQKPESTTTTTSAAPKADAAHDDDLTIDMPTNKKDGVFHVTLEMVTEWKAAFPALDVEQQIRSMKAWLEANPSNRTENVKRFIVNWLTRNQDRPPPKRDGAMPTHTYDAEEAAKAAEHLKTATFALRCESCREPRPVDQRFGICPSCGVMSGWVGATREDVKAYEEWTRKGSA